MASAERLLAQEIARLIEQNKNGPPVVYLRSFGAEAFTPFKYWTGENVAGFPMYWKDVGDAVVEALRVIGPTLAIGRPDSDGFRYWSPARVEKIMVADDAWQDVMSVWLARAALVVIQIDATEGLKWEIAQVAQFLRPTAVLLILPPTKDQYRNTCAALDHLFPKPLPPSLPMSRLLSFRENWDPLPLPKGPGVGGLFWYAVEAVFDQNGFEMPPWRRSYGFGPRV
jgi:hypothetical protein